MNVCSMGLSQEFNLFLDRFWRHTSGALQALEVLVPDIGWPIWCLVELLVYSFEGAHVFCRLLWGGVCVCMVRECGVFILFSFLM